MKRAIYLVIITLITVACIYIGTNGRLGGFHFDFNNGIKVNYDEGGNSLTTANESTVEQFSKIKAECKVLDIYVQSGENYNYSFDCTEGLEPAISVENGTLKIDQQDKRKFKAGTCKATLYITIPKNEVIANADITTGVGNIKSESVEYDECNFKTNVGDIKMESCVISSATLTSDVGDIKIDQSKSKTLYTSTNTGDTKLNDSTFNKLNATSNIGNVVVNTSDSIKDYGMDLRTNIGEVKVLGNRYSKSYKCEGDKEFDITVVNDIGDVKINY